MGLRVFQFIVWQGRNDMENDMERRVVLGVFAECNGLYKLRKSG